MRSNHLADDRLSNAGLSEWIVSKRFTGVVIEISETWETGKAYLSLN